MQRCTKLQQAATGAAAIEMRHAGALLLVGASVTGLVAPRPRTNPWTARRATGDAGFDQGDEEGETEEFRLPGIEPLSPMLSNDTSLRDFFGMAARARPAYRCRLPMRNRSAAADHIGAEQQRAHGMRTVLASLCPALPQAGKHTG